MARARRGALLLAAGEFADAPVGEIANLEEIENALDDFMVFALGVAEPAEVDVSAGEDEPADGHGEAPVEFTALGEIGDAMAAATGRRAVDAEDAGGEGKKSGGGFEEGAFACAIGADERDARALWDGKRDAVDGGALGVGIGDDDIRALQRRDARGGGAVAVAAVGDARIPVFFRGRIFNRRGHWLSEATSVLTLYWIILM